MDPSHDSLPDLTDPFADMLGFHLRRTSVAVMSALSDQLQPLGVNPGEATLLLWIGANEGRTQSDVGRALRAQPANLVPLINKLSLLGAIDRTPGKGRAITLSLSPQGRDLHAGVKQAFARHEARIGRALPAGRRAELVVLLRQICLDACCADTDGNGEAR